MNYLAILIEARCCLQRIQLNWSAVTELQIFFKAFFAIFATLLEEGEYE